MWRGGERGAGIGRGEGRVGHGAAGISEKARDEEFGVGELYGISLLYFKLFTGVSLLYFTPFHRLDVINGSSNGDCNMTAVGASCTNQKWHRQQLHEKWHR